MFSVFRPLVLLSSRIPLLQLFSGRWPVPLLPVLPGWRWEPMVLLLPRGWRESLPILLPVLPCGRGQPMALSCRKGWRPLMSIPRGQRRGASLPISSRKRGGPLPSNITFIRLLSIPRWQMSMPLPLSWKRLSMPWLFFPRRPHLLFFIPFPQRWWLSPPVLVPVLREWWLSLDWLPLSQLSILRRSPPSMTLFRIPWGWLSLFVLPIWRSVSSSTSVFPVLRWWPSSPTSPILLLLLGLRHLPSWRGHRPSLSVTNLFPFRWNWLPVCLLPLPVLFLWRRPVLPALFSISWRGALLPLVPTENN